MCHRVRCPWSSVHGFVINLLRHLGLQIPPPAPPPIHTPLVIELVFLAFLL